MKKYSLLLLSGGIGTRMQQELPKQHLLLFGRPIIIHTLERIDELEDIEDIIITCPKQYIGELDKMIDNYNLKKNYIIIEGGKTRQESVFKGLSRINTESIIIHEAARPFVKIEEFKYLIDSEGENVSLGLDIPFTVLKTKDGVISENLNRSELVNIQLPQKFNTSELKEAHQKAIDLGEEFTEDASLLLKYSNSTVRVIKGSDYNIKITTPVDYKIAEIIYKDYILNEPS
jgi:2-C-methyl-D-erythritol 4-phosphate cytidylyltransferase